MDNNKINEKFKSGETVKLISGGPIMTVKKHDYAGVECQWFAGKKLESGYFSPDSLIRVSADEKEK